MAEETIEVAMIAETIALTGKKEESTHLTEEITVPDIETGKTDMKIKEEIGKNTHQKKAEGTQVTGEGDARGP